MKDDLHLFYSTVAEKYDTLEYTHKLNWFRLAEEKHALELLKGKASVLDVGCGTGEHLSYILKQFPNIRAVGVDFTRQMIRIASKKLNNQVTLINADIRNIFFPSNHFDCTICFCTLPNISGYKKLFKSLAYSSKTMCISIYHVESASEFLKFYYQNGFSPRMEGRKLVTKEGFQYDFIPQAEIYKLFEMNNFKVSEAKYEIGSIYKGKKDV